MCSKGEIGSKMTSKKAVEYLIMTQLQEKKIFFYRIQLVWAEKRIIFIDSLFASNLPAEIFFNNFNNK